MSDKRQTIAVVGLVGTMIFAAYMVAQLNGQERSTSGNFTNASIAEVRDAQGTVVLRGQFAVADEDDDDIERKATLTPVGSDTDASGEAEIEFSPGTPTTQEIEFSVRNLQPGLAITFMIDGTDVVAATTDSRGRAEVEFDVRMP
jgi:hypothetical protein